MGGMKISDLDFLQLLPAFMRDDEAAIALSKAMDKLLGEPGKRLSTIRTWDKIDELNEAECDEMAWELDVDWYDSAGMSLEEKRNTIKLAQQIKRKRGTKWAVEQLISAYFGKGYVVEWFEKDDATPYTFEVLTTNTDITAENYGKFVEAVKAAKNERSHIAGVFYLWEQGPDPGVEYALDSSLHRYDFVKCGTRDRTATVGFIIKPAIETEPETTPHLYGFKAAGALTCGTYPRPGTLGAVVKNAIETEPETAPHLYDLKKAGELTCGTYPRAATLGAVTRNKVGTEPETIPHFYGFKECGTYPRAGTVGAAIKNRITTAPAAAFVAYVFTKCGTRCCGE